MAEDMPSGPVELGAQIDYREHEKSYGVFVGLTKYATLGTVALLLAMAFGFFAGGGFFSATILFVLLCAAGAYLLRDF